ncbi:hypothetical protein KSF78_0000263 [Schistosoma japonicum]|nr:hypothetical protein KSF78_0000263 [Schistosoma japonicum]
MVNLSRSNQIRQQRNGLLINTYSGKGSGTFIRLHKSLSGCHFRRRLVDYRYVVLSSATKDPNFLEKGLLIIIATISGLDSVYELEPDHSTTYFSLVNIKKSVIKALDYQLKSALSIKDERIIKARKYVKYDLTLKSVESSSNRKLLFYYACLRLSCLYYLSLVILLTVYNN